MPDAVFFQIEQSSSCGFWRQKGVKRKSLDRKFLTASTMEVESQQKVDIGPQSTLISTMNVLESC